MMIDRGIDRLKQFVWDHDGYVFVDNEYLEPEIFATNSPHDDDSSEDQQQQREQEELIRIGNSPYLKMMSLWLAYNRHDNQTYSIVKFEMMFNTVAIMDDPYDPYEEGLYYNGEDDTFYSVVRRFEEDDDEEFHEGDFDYYYGRNRSGIYTTYSVINSNDRIQDIFEMECHKELDTLQHAINLISYISFAYRMA